jgi:hypothetical protein
MSTQQNESLNSDFHSITESNINSSEFNPNEFRNNIFNMFTQQNQQIEALRSAFNSISASIPASSSNVSRSVNPSIGPIKAKVSPPSNFSGARNSNVETWLYEMQRYLQLCAVPLSEQLPYATSYLKDAALNWWISTTKSNNPILTFPQFEIALKQRFQPVCGAQTARNELKKLQQGNLSVSEYTNRFYNLVQQITDMSEVDQKETYIGGLKFQIANIVEGREPATLAAAMTQAQKVEILFENQFQRTRNNKNNIHNYSPISTYFDTAPMYPVFSSISSNSSSSTSPSSSSSSSPSVPVAMDLGNVNVDDQELIELTGEDLEQEYQQYLENGEEYEYDYTAKQQTSITQQGEKSEEQEEKLNFIKNRASREQLMTRQEFTRCIQQRLCLRCKQPGHVARFCPLPRSNRRPPYPSPSYSSNVSSRTSYNPNNFNRNYNNSQRNFH